MSLIVKICGLCEPATLEAALSAGADMVGFVFFPPSPRHLSEPAAEALGADVRGRARKVALTVDADDMQLAAIIAALKPDLLQLHGSETPARVAVVRARFCLPIIKALAVAEPGDLADVEVYDKVADHLLFDARAPVDADRPGGNGAPFDWSLLSQIRTSRPWFLAGGLGPGNIIEALAATGAPAVDVSSGVEIARGKKDAGLIRDFIAAARRAEAAPLQDAR